MHIDGEDRIEVMRPGLERRPVSGETRAVDEDAERPMLGNQLGDCPDITDVERHRLDVAAIGPQGCSRLLQPLAAARGHDHLSTGLC